MALASSSAGCLTFKTPARRWKRDFNDVLGTFAAALRNSEAIQAIAKVSGIPSSLISDAFQQH